MPVNSYCVHLVKLLNVCEQACGVCIVTSRDQNPRKTVTIIRSLRIARETIVCTAENSRNPGQCKVCEIR